LNIKRRKPSGKPLQLPVDKLPVPDLPEIKKVKGLEWLWWKLNGNKRNIGFAMQGVGYILTIWMPAGWGLVAIGGILTGVGVIHDQVKKKKDGDNTIWDRVLEIVNLIIEYLKGVKK